MGKSNSELKILGMSLSAGASCFAYLNFNSGDENNGAFNVNVNNSATNKNSNLGFRAA